VQESTGAASPACWREGWWNGYGFGLAAIISYHHDLKIELDDAWWAEAQMAGFVPLSRAYRVDVAGAKGQRIFEARIDEVGPVRRNPGIGIVNKNEELTAREQVLRILNGFRSNAAIPPIELVDAPAARLAREQTARQAVGRTRTRDQAQRCEKLVEQPGATACILCRHRHAVRLAL